MSFTRSMYKVGIDIGGTNTKFLLFDKKIKDYSKATIEVVKTPINLIEGNKVYIDIGGIKQMINSDKPVIFDCLVDKQENCYPMIPSGKPHNQMLLGPEDEKDVSDEGKTLV